MTSIKNYRQRHDFEFLSYILGKLNLKITEKDDDVILKLKKVDLKYLKKLTLNFFVGVIIYIFIIILSVGFDFSKINHEDWPFMNNNSTFTKYYSLNRTIEVAEYFDHYMIKNYPNCLDYIIWFMSSGISLTLTTNKIGFSFFGLMTNYLLCIFESYSLFSYLIKVDWKDKFILTWVGFLSFSTQTYANHIIQGIILNLIMRWVYFLGYVASAHIKGSLNAFLCKIVLLGIFIIIPLTIIAGLGIILIIGSFIILFPYFLSGIIFSILPFLLVVVIAFNISGLIVFPIQYLLRNLIKFKKNLTRKKLSFDDDSNDKTLIQDEEYTKKCLFIDKKNTIQDNLILNVNNAVIVNCCEVFSNNKNGEKTEEVEINENIRNNNFIPNRFKFMFQELILIIRFYLILLNLSLQFSIYLYNGFNIFGICYIFIGLPYFSLNLYSFKFMKYFDNISFLFAKISSLL